MIPVNEPLLNGNEKKYLNECIDTGWISSEGPFVKRLETDFANRCQRKYGIAVANGSVALDVAISALGIGVGDEVIMPTFTIMSCAAPIVRAGAIPVVIEADANTWNMKVQDIEAKITSKTKAIMAVHIYGIPVDMDPIIDLAKKYNLKVIEDAAQLIGHTYKGKPCGSFGDISTFSFYPNKHITTGEGGMVLTNDDEIAKKCSELRNLCFIPPRRFIHEDLGWNFRMTNLQAALGVAQLEQLDLFLQKKRQIGNWYNELLKDISQIQLPIQNTTYAENIYWVYGVVLTDDVPFDALEAMKRLSDKKIGTRPFFYPMHKQPVFLKMNLFSESDSYPISERIAERGFYLPSGLSLTKENAENVAEALKSIFI
uniref:DegT/DnrJ/EryC1/StrS family aminotransferase n=1 Tax=Pedobacter schmidteae TaxID=2201271 RepID=UPI000EB33FAD|nr:DegT/DnrJ/EryC1/StrS family aminotransferase [Pedobacter schmidteae]